MRVSLDDPVDRFDDHPRKGSDGEGGGGDSLERLWSRLELEDRWLHFEKVYSVLRTWVAKGGPRGPRGFFVHSTRVSSVSDRARKTRRKTGAPETRSARNTEKKLQRVVRKLLASVASSSLLSFAPCSSLLSAILLCILGHRYPGSFPHLGRRQKEPWCGVKPLSPCHCLFRRTFSDEFRHLSQVWYVRWARMISSHFSLIKDRKT